MKYLIFECDNCETENRFSFNDLDTFCGFLCSGCHKKYTSKYLLKEYKNKDNNLNIRVCSMRYSFVHNQITPDLKRT